MNIQGSYYSYRLTKKDDGELGLQQALHSSCVGESIEEKWVDIPTVNAVNQNPAQAIDEVELFKKHMRELDERLANAGELLEESDKEVDRLNAELAKSKDQCERLMEGIEYEFKRTHTTTRMDDKSEKDPKPQADYPKIPKGLDEFHVHEVVDRLHVIISMIEEHISGHPLIEAVPLLKDKINLAMNVLCDVYQKAGCIGFKPPDE